jgi:Na+/melibiose symporter-like transporter
LIDHVATCVSSQVLNTLYAAEELGWDEVSIGFIWAGAGLISLLVVVLYNNQLAFLSERALFYFCLVVLIVSQALLIHWNIGPIHFLQYFAGVLLTALGFNMERIVMFALFTALLGHGYKVRTCRRIIIHTHTHTHTHTDRD